MAVVGRSKVAAVLIHHGQRLQNPTLGMPRHAIGQLFLLVRFLYNDRAFKLHQRISWRKHIVAFGGNVVFGVIHSTTQDLYIAKLNKDQTIQRIVKLLSTSLPLRNAYPNIQRGHMIRKKKISEFPYKLYDSLARRQLMGTRAKVKEFSTGPT